MSDPYRASSPQKPDPIITCPFCGNEAPALAETCPHCDVRLEDHRCTKCFTLSDAGAFECKKCGQALTLAPLFDLTDAPCPRCRNALEASASGDFHECTACGGKFVPRETLAKLLAAAEKSGEKRRGSTPPEDVRYLPCPLCHVPMNRVRQSTGVIVDECRRHGTWFDTGELSRAISGA